MSKMSKTMLLEHDKDYEDIGRCFVMENQSRSKLHNPRRDTKTAMTQLEELVGKRRNSIYRSIAYLLEAMYRRDTKAVGYDT